MAMPSVEGLPDDVRNRIVALCNENETCHIAHFNSRIRSERFVVLKPYFIKYESGHTSLLSAYKTQSYIYSQTIDDPAAPRVPQVFDYFHKGHWSYLVMEYIRTAAPTVPPSPSGVAEALQWLSRVRVPTENLVGPVGGGRFCHDVFLDFESPMGFNSVAALERYMNAAISRLPPRGRELAKPIQLTNEPAFFTQSNMKPNHFIVDTAGKICMVDFEAVGVLPRSFAHCTLSTAGAMTDTAFIKEVARCLDWPESPNRASMARASYIIRMSGDSALGLNEDGFPKVKAKHRR